MKVLRIISSGWIGLLASAGIALGEEPVWHRQIWVPAGELETVLAKLHQPVQMTPAEYQSLMRDLSLSERAGQTAAPREAILKRLSMTGEIQDRVLLLTATYEWENFQPGPVEVPVPLPQPELAAFPAEKEAKPIVVRMTGEGKAVARLEGLGLHRLVARFQLPVTRSEAGFEAQLQSLPFAPASLRIPFEDGVAVTANAPVLAEAGGDHLFSMPTTGDGLVLRWRRSGKDAAVPVAVRQSCRYLYFFDQSGLQAELGIVLTAELSDLPGDLRFVLPAPAQIVDVSGSAVSHWTAADGFLTVRLASGVRGPVQIRVLLERPALPEDADSANLPLPMLRAEVATRVEGRIDVFGGPGVRAESVSAPGWFFPVAAERRSALEGEAACVAALEFPVWEGAPPEVRLRRFVPRVHASVDTLVSVDAESIRLRHDAVFAAQDGEIFTSRLHLGAGERLETVEVTGPQLAEWTVEAGVLRLDWKNGLAAGSEGRIRVRTRLDSQVWSRDRESARIAISGVRAEGDTQDGYLGVMASADCQVSVRREEGMQGRDPRRTPVAGELAWRRLEECSLELDVSRLRPAYDVHITTFVIPDSKKVDLEGQVDVAIRHSALGELRFAFAPEFAGLVRFSSPLISGQWPDLSTGIVTVRFHHELTGFQQLRWRMSLPGKPVQEGNEIRFAAALPKLDVPGASRLTGQWMIEAMNDTTVTVESSQAKAFDTLRVPAIAGYMPRYRVVAALDHRGADHGIVLRGLQHVNRPVLGLVVRRMSIDTAISEEGREIHDTELHFDNRAASEVKLGVPVMAQITMLTVDGETQRPIVAEEPSDGISQRIRVALPRTGQVIVRLSYVQDGLPWDRSGDAVVAPLLLEATLPVQETDWRLHLPADYRFERFSGGLRPSFAEQPKALLPLIWARIAPEIQTALGWSGPKAIAPEAPTPPPAMDANRGLGVVFAFRGEQAPAKLLFRYAHHEEAMRFAWAWLLGGMIGFWVLAAARPAVVGMTGVVLLTFLPVSGLTDLVSVANCLLAGWLMLFLATQFWRILTAGARASGPRELPTS